MKEKPLVQNVNANLPNCFLKCTLNVLSNVPRAPYIYCTLKYPFIIYIRNDTSPYALTPCKYLHILHYLWHDTLWPELPESLKHPAIQSVWQITCLQALLLQLSKIKVYFCGMVSRISKTSKLRIIYILGDNWRTRTVKTFPNPKFRGSPENISTF